MSSFDADALERAAKFARELERTSNSRAYIEMSKREQTLKQAEASKEQAKFEKEAAAYKIQQEKVRWEEQRKTIEANKQSQFDLEKHRAQVKAQLLDEEDRKARKRNEELVSMQTRARAQQEELRRKTEMAIQEERRRTDEHRARLERDNLRARAIAEAEGRIKEARENEDVNAREIALRGEQRRQQIKDAIQTTFAEAGTAATNFITDPDRVTKTLVALTVGAAGIYATREAARVAGRVLERRLLTPSLVRETSRTSGMFSPAAQLRRMFSRRAPTDAFSDVVLAPTLSTRIDRTAVSVANARKNAAPYRHMLFYGPPGTGKTMVAKRLARSSGMDYAIMSGGDVGPLGAGAVTELHKLFDWSERSSRGLLLFIDEADAFLASRSKSAMSEEMRNALNAVLFRTGEASRDLMLVLATNRPGDLDAAVNDRVDEALMFGLPDEEGRKLLLRQYFNQYIARAGEEAPARGVLRRRAATAKIDFDAAEFDDAFFDSLARRLNGFSGRAISKLLIAVQGNVYGQETPKLTRQMFEEVVQWKLAEFADKQAFDEYA